MMNGELQLRDLRVVHLAYEQSVGESGEQAGGDLREGRGARSCIRGAFAG